VRTAGGLLDWIGAHPGRAGIAVVRSGGRSLLSQSAQRRFPLASTRKVLIVGAYAEAVAAGTLDPAQPVALADVERYYLPGTDGGAHPAAVEEWAARGTVTGAPGAEVVPLDELARAAIVQSDNAAADYLLVRLGAETVTAFAASNRMARQDPPAPLLGEYLAWTQRTPAAWAALTPAQRARQAFRLAAAGEPATSFPGVARQRRFVRSSVAGTPADWARLMARIGAGRGSAPPPLRCCDATSSGSASFRRWRPPSRGWATRGAACPAASPRRPTSRRRDAPASPSPSSCASSRRASSARCRSRPRPSG